jgi:predicted Zn-dependent protease
MQQRRALTPPLAALAAAVILAAPARAGLNGQPPAPAKFAEQVSPLVRKIATGSDTGGGRTGLIGLVEANAAADITDLLASALGDATTYTSLAATLEDAREAASGESEKRFIGYNLARVHVLRARLLPAGPARRAPLAAAESVVRAFEADKVRDPALWELAGDVYTERDDLPSAEAAYKRMGSSGGGPALVQLKLAQAYQRARRYDVAVRAYEAGIRADSGTGDSLRGTYHRLAQGLASVYLAQGNDPAAGEALLLSARAKPDTAAPYTYQTGVARALLRRGARNAAAVRAYAEAALRSAPDDEDLKQLLADARAAGGTRRP